MWYSPPRPLFKSEEAFLERRLFVRNLNSTMDSDSLENLFSVVGEVVSASVEVKQVRGNDHRFGYVEMATEQEAMDSIQRFHGYKYQDSILVVTEDIPHVPILLNTKGKKLRLAKAHSISLG